MFFFCFLVNIVEAIFALVMAEVGDAERFTVIVEGLSNQVGSFPWFYCAGRVLDSGGERSLVETNVSSVDYFLCR